MSIAELLAIPENFSEARGSAIHVLNALTGKTIAIFQAQTKAGVNTHMVETEIDGEMILVEKAYEPLIIPGSLEPQLSEHLVSLICQQLVEGKTLTEICGQKGFPSWRMLTLWRSKNDWVATAIDAAKADRAEYYIDEVLKEARAAESKDPAEKTKILIDALKYVAAIDNPKYSPRSKVDHSVTVPTTIIVQTGISRNLDTRDVSPQTSDQGEPHAALQSTSQPEPSKD